ncbi:MAG: DNA polymerase III subunit chi [Janthinobacterium lividum]
MTRIDFHTNVADRLGYACRLVRKVYGAGQPVVVLGDRPALTAFDAALWTFSALDFIPHCMGDSPLAAQTPIVLAENTDTTPHHAILLNLRDEVPANFARFERLLELVSDAPDALDAGRERYRFYRDRGYQLNLFKQG